MWNLLNGLNEQKFEAYKYCDHAELFSTFFFSPLFLSYIFWSHRENWCQFPAFFLFLFFFDIVCMCVPLLFTFFGRWVYQMIMHVNRNRTTSIERGDGVYTNTYRVPNILRLMGSCIDFDLHNKYSILRWSNRSVKKTKNSLTHTHI